MTNFVPSGWTSVPFGQLCTQIVNGGTPDTEVAAFWSGDIPWITGADFTSAGISEPRRHVSAVGIRNSATSVVRQGNLLVVTRTGVGKLAIAPCDMAISQDITGVYIDPNQADTRFIYYTLCRELDELKKLNQGTSINGIVRSDLERHVVQIPTDRTIQTRIAHVLATVDASIELSESLIVKYQQIKAGLMHDLFTRGVLEDGRLRPNRSEAPELYVHTLAGWVPAEWKAAPLRTCLIGTPVNGLYKSADQIGAEGTLLVGQTAFTEERSLDFSLCRRGFISAAELRKYGLSKNDILVTRVFATVEGVGLPTMVPEMIEDAVFESNMMRLRVDARVVAAPLLFELLRLPSARRKIGAGVNASNQCSINQLALNSLPIPIPPCDEQARILDRISSADTHLTCSRAQLAKLRRERLGLMDDLLTGRVPPAVGTAHA